MKLLILTLCVAYAVADVSHVLPKGLINAQSQIIKQELDVGPDGSYQYAYEADNGISASQQGHLKNPESEDAAQEVQGQAQWSSPEGEIVQLSYIANENGYQPTGSHLPTSPPIPEAIRRSLEFIAAHPQQPEN